MDDMNNEKTKQLRLYERLKTTKEELKASIKDEITKFNVVIS